MNGVTRTIKIAIQQFDPQARALQSDILVSARSQGKSTFRVDGIIVRRQSHRNITKRPNSRASAARAGFARRKANIRSLALASSTATEELPPRQASTAVDREQAEWSTYR